MFSISQFFENLKVFQLFKRGSSRLTIAPFHENLLNLPSSILRYNEDRQVLKNTYFK